jgi:arsenate reductase
MAEGILKSFDPELEVYSAGTFPAYTVHPYSIAVMKEIGIDISENYPKNVNQFLNISFDYVITVCDNARRICPIFTGKVRNRIHMGFEDPIDATGSEEEILSVYRKIRDQIKERFYKFYIENLKQG